MRKSSRVSKRCANDARAGPPDRCKANSHRYRWRTWWPACESSGNPWTFGPSKADGRPTCSISRSTSGERFLSEHGAGQPAVPRPAAGAQASRREELSRSDATRDGRRMDCRERPCPRKKVVPKPTFTLHESEIVFTVGERQQHERTLCISA